MASTRFQLEIESIHPEVFYLAVGHDLIGEMDMKEGVAVLSPCVEVEMQRLDKLC